MERAQARRLQPHFIGAFFREASPCSGGRIAEREKGRFEITRVPVDPEGARPADRPRRPGARPLCPDHLREGADRGQPQAELVAPGHPLLDALVDVVLERFQPLLRQGGVLVDETDDGASRASWSISNTPSATGAPAGPASRGSISQRLQFVLPGRGRYGHRWRAGPLSRLPADHGRGARRWSTT